MVQKVTAYIWTRKSLATDLLDFSVSSTNSNPMKYIPPTEENLKARNPSAKTRQLIIGIVFVFILRFIPYLFVKNASVMLTVDIQFYWNDYFR